MPEHKLVSSSSLDIHTLTIRPRSIANKGYQVDLDRMCAYDGEVYPDFWCFVFQQLGPDGETVVRSVANDRNGLIDIIEELHRSGMTLVGFGSAHYDGEIVDEIASGRDPYQRSVEIIHPERVTGKKRRRTSAKPRPILGCDHIDLKCMYGRTGLKTIAGNLSFPHLEELPYDPDLPITGEQQQHVLAYCKKDTEATWRLLRYTHGVLRSQSLLSHRFGVDLRACSDPQLFERIRKHILGWTGRLKPLEAPLSIRYDPPPDLIETPPIAEVAMWHRRIVGTEISMLRAAEWYRALAEGTDGTIPKKLRPKPDIPKCVFELLGMMFKTKKGGIHSQHDKLKPTYVEASDEFELWNIDAQSNYPSIIRNLKLEPRAHTGKGWLEHYGEITDERIRCKALAKSTSDRLEQDRLVGESDSLKLCINRDFPDER